MFANLTHGFADNPLPSTLPHAQRFKLPFPVYNIKTVSIERKIPDKVLRTPDIGNIKLLIATTKLDIIKSTEKKIA